MAPGISFGHFNIVGGVVREDGPYVAVIEDRTPAESVADLYVVIEPAQPGSEPFCPELLKLIEAQFGRPQYSLTGNLLQSLRAAQEHLRAWNKTAPQGKQASAGASCLAVSGDEAYLAQIGPGVAYLRHDGLLRRLQPIDPEEKAPLGTSIGCSPCFNRFDLSTGDTLLLTSSRFATLVDDETTDLILSLPAGEALPEIYKIARHETEFSALYLAVTGTLRSSARTEEIDEAQRARSYPSARGLSRGGGSADASRYGFSSQGPYSRLLATSDVGSSRTDVSGRTKRRELDRLTERHMLSLPRPAMYTVAALLALTLAGWVGLPHLLQTGRQDRFSSLMHDAQKQAQTAAATRDPAQKRSLLTKAQADLVEARTIRAQAPELLTLQGETDRALKGLDQVRQLPSTQTVVDLATTPIAARSVTELVATSKLYVLDSSSGKVYGFGGNTATDPSMPIFEAGKVVEGIQTGKAAHLAVRLGAAGAPALLYVLDSNRRLFSLDESGGLAPVALAGTDAWKSATAIATRGADLYVLDSAANQVWHYAAGGTGFANAPSPTLGKVDLHDASQLAIGGDIYISTVNGRLLRLHDGRPTDVKLDGIDHALVAPQPPILDGTSGTEYIADPGNQRIVAADGQDVYRYQYAGAALTGLRAIALDPGSGVLYALTGQKIVAASLH